MPVLTAIDTLASVNQGNDENGVHDMTLFNSSCDRIRNATGGTVTVVHHTNKNGDIRGSTAFPGALDTILLCTMDDAKTTVTLQCKKPRDDAPFDPMHFSLQADEGSGSVYLESTEHPGDGTGLLNAKEQRVRDAIAEQGDKWLALKDITTLLPQIPDSTLQKIIRHLVKKGELETDGEGRNTRYRVPAARRFD
jgi:hypothetical protein